MIEVELRGLEVFGHHGVSETEQERGQTLLWDVAWRLGEVSRDDLSATVDYVEVAECVRGVSDSGRYQLLESLAQAAADAIYGRFQLRWVRVRVRKTELDLPVEFTAATVERP
jgi:7,8-dihydroneopterin aldolase/epimerase/oxygenase